MNKMSVIMNVIVLLAVFGVAVRAYPMLGVKEDAAVAEQFIYDKVEATLPIRQFTNNNEDPFKTAKFRLKRDGGDEEGVIAPAPKLPVGELGISPPEGGTPEAGEDASPPPAISKPEGVEVASPPPSGSILETAVPAVGKPGNSKPNYEGEEPEATPEPSGGTPENQPTQATTESVQTASTTENSSGTKTIISKAAILLFSLLIIVKGNFGNC